MKVFKKVGCIFLTLVFAAAAIVCFPGCSPKDRKRDVTIIIFDDLGNSFEFLPDVKELRTTRT